jgi:integrase
MAKRTTRLTAAALKSLIKEPGRHSDGNGLFFRVLPGEKGYWVYRYPATVNGKRTAREMSLGTYPEMRLSKARVLHAAAHAKVTSDKIDPLAEKQAVKEADAAKQAVKTFGQACDDYIETHAGSWRSDKHRYQWRHTLGEYCKPIRETPVHDIDTKAVRSVLDPIWNRARTTAAGLRGRIEKVLDAAQADGLIDRDRANPARWKGHLEHLLPKIGKPTHRRAMPYADVPAFFAKLMGSPDSAPRALAFTILTGMRTKEVRLTTWDEIDLDLTATLKGQNGQKDQKVAMPLWSVPGARMKMGRLHQVPLSDAAVAILKRQWETRGKNKFVFPGERPAKPLSENALARAMKRMGGRDTVHGFRSSFRDWAGDETNFQREVAEAALSHAVGDQTERAYRRGDALLKRRELMQAWAIYLNGEPSADVVPITAGKKRRL